MPLHPGELPWLLALGLCAGAIGGLVGVGGSIIMIPVLTLLLHRNQHLSQAAAMIVNVFVAAPALLQHHRAEAVRWSVILRMLPAGLLFIVLGVELSNRVDEAMLKRIFGVFLLYVAGLELYMLVRRNGGEPGEPRVGWVRDGAVGGVMGAGAGLLGIGGGPIAVPLLHRVSRLPLREAIAATSAVMCMTSAVGAVRKNLTLPSLDLNPYESLFIALCLAPTAIVGAMVGARLLHVIPLVWARVAFIALVAWAAFEMLAHD